MVKVDSTLAWTLCQATDAFAFISAATLSYTIPEYYTGNERPELRPCISNNYA